jgi:hypothetical protein
MYPQVLDLIDFNTWEQPPENFDGYYKLLDPITYDEVHSTDIWTEALEDHRRFGWIIQY